MSTKEGVLLGYSTSNAADLRASLATLEKGTRHTSFTSSQVVRQLISDRFTLAAGHLRVGDELLLALQFRSSISRHYYAMYHAARAMVFADIGGDDHQRHAHLPDHLPASLPDSSRRKQELIEARLLRNEADYSPYPEAATDWEPDARQLVSTAANFVHACEVFVLANDQI